MIDELRKEIDKIDSEIISLLAKRIALSQKIGNEKQTTGADIHVKTREITVLDQVKLLGNQSGLDDAFITSLYQVVLTESRRVQGEA